MVSIPRVIFWSWCAQRRPSSLMCPAASASMDAFRCSTQSRGSCASLGLNALCAPVGTLDIINTTHALW